MLRIAPPVSPPSDIPSVPPFVRDFITKNYGISSDTNMCINYDEPHRVYLQVDGTVTSVYYPFTFSTTSMPAYNKNVQFFPVRQTKTSNNSYSSLQHAKLKTEKDSTETDAEQSGIQPCQPQTDEKGSTTTDSICNAEQKKSCGKSARKKVNSRWSKGFEPPASSEECSLTREKEECQLSNQKVELQPHQRKRMSYANSCPRYSVEKYITNADYNVAQKTFNRKPANKKMKFKNSNDCKPSVSGEKWDNIHREEKLSSQKMRLNPVRHARGTNQANGRQQSQIATRTYNTTDHDIVQKKLSGKIACKKVNSGDSGNCRCYFGMGCTQARKDEGQLLNKTGPGANCKSKTKVCKMFAAYGVCPFGSLCLFIHSSRRFRQSYRNTDYNWKNKVTIKSEKKFRKDDLGRKLSKLSLEPTGLSGTQRLRLESKSLLAEKSPHGKGSSSLGESSLTEETSVSEEFSIVERSPSVEGSSLAKKTSLAEESALVEELISIAEWSSAEDEEDWSTAEDEEDWSTAEDEWSTADESSSADEWLSAEEWPTAEECLPGTEFPVFKRCLQNEELPLTEELLSLKGNVVGRIAENPMAEGGK